MNRKSAARSFGGFIEKVVKSRRGRARVPIVLAAALVLLAFCVPFVEWAYWSGFNALMRLWGITGRNVARAPWFARQLVRYSSVILTLIQGALLLFSSRRLADRLKIGKASPRRFGAFAARGALDGAVSMLVLWLGLLALDNMRLGRSLMRPEWSVNALILPLTIALWAAAALAWGVGLIARFLSERIPRTAAVALSALLLAPVLPDSLELNGLLDVNLLLCGAVCCLSLKKTGSWAWAWGFLCGLWILERAVLGFPGYTAALYETYPVNSYWLNGGERGLWHGASTTLILLCHGVRFVLPLRKRAAS